MSTSAQNPATEAPAAGTTPAEAPAPAAGSGTSRPHEQAPHAVAVVIPVAILIAYVLSLLVDAAATLVDRRRFADDDGTGL